MEGGAVILGVDDVSVQHDEGLGVGVDGVHATDVHVETQTRRSVTLDCVDVTGHLLLDVVLDGDAAAFIDHQRALGRNRCGFVVEAVEVGTDELAAGLSVLYGNLQGSVTLYGDIDSV